MSIASVLYMICEHKNMSQRAHRRVAGPQQPGTWRQPREGDDPRLPPLPLGFGGRLPFAEDERALAALGGLFLYFCLYAVVYVSGL